LSQSKVREGEVHTALYSRHSTSASTTRYNATTAW